ncbi:MAG TPA: hypothetical protein VFX07_01105 [Candidatus Udaeobacter sp.]|jgi:hypothetical protein|nr:hypothetical protein [Candidatus Udaeobacter sp.]
MRDKTKKTKTQMKFRDLKPAKDAKGGIPPDPCRRGRSGFYAGNHNETLL